MSKFKVLNNKNIPRARKCHQQTQGHVLQDYVWALTRSCKSLNRIQETPHRVLQKGGFWPCVFWGNGWRVMHKPYRSPNPSQIIHCPKKPTEERRISGEAAGCSPTFSTRERQIQAHSFTTTYVEQAGFNEMCSHCTLWGLSTPECFLSMDCWAIQKALANSLSDFQPIPLKNRVVNVSSSLTR